MRHEESKAKLVIPTPDSPVETRNNDDVLYSPCFQVKLEERNLNRKYNEGETTGGDMKLIIIIIIQTKPPWRR